MDAHGVDALPLLAFTLERLYTDYGGDGGLHLDEYSSMGDITGVIEAAVTEALANPESPPVIPNGVKEQEQLLREAFIPWLAEVDKRTGERQRRIALWEEIPGDARPLEKVYMRLKKNIPET